MISGYSKLLNTRPSISELLASTGEPEDNSITSQSKRRPTGVTILAVLGFITAIFAVLGGLGLIFISTLSVEIEYFVIFGVILLALGIITPFISYGFLKGSGWSWTVGLITEMIIIVVDIANIAGYFGNTNQDPIGATINIVIAVIIVIYLTRPHVKDFFGKVHTASEYAV